MAYDYHPKVTNAKRRDPSRIAPAPVLPWRVSPEYRYGVLMLRNLARCAEYRKIQSLKK